MTRAWSLALVLLVLSLNGCLFRSRNVERVATNAALLTASRDQLVTRMNEMAARIKTLNASVEIATTVGGSKKGKITDYTDISGYVLVRKPEHLRMIGLVPVVRTRAFDMVSDGREFKLSVPPKNKFIVGRNDVVYPSKQPLESLRPQHILDALLIREVDAANEIAVLEAGTQTVVDVRTRKKMEQPDYVLSIVRRDAAGAWSLSRKVIFGRDDLLPDSQIIYDAAGNVATEADYADFKEFNGASFPTTIRIHRPQEEYLIVLSVTKMRMNEPLTDEQFVLEQPAGSELQRLDVPRGTSAEGTAPPHP